MGGIGLTLNAAKDALLAQKYAIDVTSHNISNVNTPGYSRQIPVLAARIPAPLDGFLFGRGVELDEIMRNADNFIEKRLQQRTMDLFSMSEKEVYMGVLEGIFNETSERSLSTQLADFYNAWHELANNPSGLAERNNLFERGSLLTQSFNDTYDDLSNLNREINTALEAGVDKINQLIEQIADLNQQIVTTEAISNANDLHDKRNSFVTQLAEYIDLNTYFQDDGSLTVTTGKGYTLVNKANYYELSFDGQDIRWDSSGFSKADITATISGGKIGGWLDMRDEIIPQYNKDLEELAEALVWEINQIHTQGVGLQGLSSVTGTYEVGAGNEGVALGSSGLDYQDQIVDDGSGTFEMWVYDANGAVVGGGPTTITINGATTLNSLAATITAVHANITGTVSGGAIQIGAASNYTFAFSNDSSYVLSALGINTFFSGNDANDISLNSILNSQKEFIAAGNVDATGAIAVGDNTTALAIANQQYQDVTIKRWTYDKDGTNTSEDITGTMESYLHSFVGSIGIKSQSIQREKQYNDVIVNELNQSRDSISAVSLDEEMTKLIQHQHAYTAAAKLISTADEMLQTLLETR
jgi:flagellar hook-associated protein 1 FlgK